MVAELNVIALAKHSYCEGGCADCSTAEYCANPGSCYQCSFTPLGLASWPTERVRVVGTWVTASPLGGPAHCELRASAYLTTSSPAWDNTGWPPPPGYRDAHPIRNFLQRLFGG